MAGIGMLRRVYVLGLMVGIVGVWCVAGGIPTARAYPAGMINPAQLSEAQVKSLMAGALKADVPYAESIYHSAGSAGGYFGSGTFNEQGMRTSADYALMYAFLYSRFPDATFGGVARQVIFDHAVAAIRYGYSTHKASGSGRWGDGGESPLWEQSFGLAAWLVRSDLSAADWQGVTTMVASEADALTTVTPPTSEVGDTQAESNAWDTNALALARALLPDDPRATTWDYKLKRFAMNTYSTAADQTDPTVVDGRPVSAWVLGPNIHPDLTLDNHNIFHPNYVTSPIWELSESALYYARAGLPVPGALKHHVRDVWDDVVKKLELGYGEPAYPNGVDWDIHRGEDIETFADMATLYHDMDAKFLEARSIQYIRARQRTTPDGSFLLNPDVGAEREAIIPCALVYAYLDYESFGSWPTASTTWQNFRASQGATKLFPSVDAITSRGANRWASFSWRDRYMGTVYPESEAHPDTPYVTFPYQNGVLGSFTGTFDVAGTHQTATVRAHSYSLSRDGFATAGELATNDGVLNQNLAFVALPDNAVVYLDTVRATQAAKVTAENGVPIGIESDTIGGDPRTLYYQGGSVRSNGSPAVSIPGNWVNVDHRLGVVMGRKTHGEGIWFGDRGERNSVYTARLYGSRLTTSRTIAAGDTVANRAVVVYSNVDQATTAALAGGIHYPTISPHWRAAIVPEPDGRQFLVAANFTGNEVAQLSVPIGPHGAPVLTTTTSVDPDSASAKLQGRQFTAQYEELGAYVKAVRGSVEAVQGADPHTAFVRNGSTSSAAAEISIRNGDQIETGTQTLAPGASYKAELQGGAVRFTATAYPGDDRIVSDGKYITASSSQPAHLPFDALDDDPTTYWTSQGVPQQDSPQSLTIDLQGPHKVRQVGVLSPNGTGPRTVTVETSSDGKTFGPVASATLPDTAGQHVIRFANTTASYVRLSVASAYGGSAAQVTELQVDGRPMLDEGQGRDPFSLYAPTTQVPIGAGSNGQATVRLISNSETPLQVQLTVHDPNSGITATPAKTTVSVPANGAVDAPITLANSYPSDLASGGASQLEVDATAAGFQTTTAIQVLPYSLTLPVSPANAVLTLDGGCAGSPVAAGYLALTPSSTWSATADYGWVGTAPGCRDRGSSDPLKRDSIDSQASATLQLAVPAGIHDVYVLVGDPVYQTTGTVISVGGKVVAHTYPTKPGQAGWTRFQVDGGSSAGTVDLTFSGVSGNYWNLSGLVLG